MTYITGATGRTGLTPRSYDRNLPQQITSRARESVWGLMFIEGWTMPMIATGPLPLASDDMTDRGLRRREAIVALGASIGQGVRYIWHTATVAWDGAAKRIYIAVDPDVMPDDWNEVCAVLRMAGWMIGIGGYDDIGEPEFDRVSQVWVWDLECP